jgi:hypothetical protein
MIEKKFNDPTGFSEKNTFFQFDQWETQRVHGGKNRYIYDFSFPILPGEADDYLITLSQPAGTEYKPYLDKILTNLSPGTNLSAYGSPGGKAKYIGALETERTVNEDEATIKVNSNTLMHINEAFSGGYGETQLSENVDFFRSGYVEFTIKTNKQNCIIASGSSQIDAKDFQTILGTFGAAMYRGASISTLSTGDTMSPKALESVDTPYYVSSSFEGALINLDIIIKDGKLAIRYYDDFNKDDVNFIFIGNDTIADNNWHHIVVNFGRPGLIKTNGVKFNKKFIEIWVDGQLDKRFDDKVNDYQIFYPTVKWLFNNLKDVIYNYLENDIDIETNMDLRGLATGSAAYGTNYATSRTIGINEISSDEDIFKLAVASDFYPVNAFAGAIHTFAHGLNIPISQYEIKRRLRLWKKQTNKFAKTVNVNAEMKMPAVSTNSKKALRLFWNNLVDNSKYGVELDKNFQVETLSVTHQLNNSSTETLNVDTKLNKKAVNILQDVRVAITDNMLVNGPGMVFFANTEEAFSLNLNLGPTMGPIQTNPKSAGLDSVGSTLNTYERFVGPRSDLMFSGIVLNNGDRILLTNQIKTEENGIWIYNGLDKYLSRAEDSLISNNDINAVYVTDGYNAGTYWKSEKSATSLLDPQKWSLINLSNTENFFADFNLNTRWKSYRGEDRFIDINSDVDLSNYDLITFVNYPEYNEQIFEMFPNDPQSEILNKYAEFIKSLKIAAANGASLFVSSPKLAEDLGIVKQYSAITQEVELGDGRAAVVNPFQFDEPAERYFDTHRQNSYHLDTEIPGLTDKETWVLTEFINYLPKNTYDYEEYHAKYSYRQFGLEEGNEFIIPSLALRESTQNDSIPGFRQNARGTKDIYAVAPHNILAGTVVTSLANNHYHGANIVVNEFDDYATTIVVHDGQLLGNYPINGKIFVNCVEDSLTMSREEYNKATIQVIPNDVVNETTSTRAWQYSTSRLNRAPRRINIKDVTPYGQVIPTNGGGGPLIQAPTNSSNGIITSETVRNNTDYQSDLYPTESEEIYPIQEIPVLSMTWLGLQWLAE